MEDCNIFEIWEDYKSSLLGYIQKRVDDRDDSKDILQEVLLKSYQFCSKGKTVLNLKSWLYKITQNAIIDYYKKDNKNIPLEFDELNNTCIIATNNHTDINKTYSNVLNIIEINYDFFIQKYNGIPPITLNQQYLNAINLGSRPFRLMNIEALMETFREKL
jgi:hypothetical protein